MNTWSLWRVVVFVLEELICSGKADELCVVAVVVVVGFFVRCDRDLHIRRDG